MFGINYNQQYVPFIGPQTLGNGFSPYAPFVPQFASPYAQMTPAYNSYAGYQPSYSGISANAGAPELNLVLNRVEEIRHQVAILTEILKLDQARRGMNTQVANGMGIGAVNGAFNGQSISGLHNHNSAAWTGLNGFNAFENASPIRLRESDSHIFMDVYLPQLTMGDVDVEVSGNRIVCRTRVPVAPLSRLWANAQIPRGFELYELADGRVEFSWIAPVTFQAKEVEATWREGFLCVCIPKQEVTPRHTVKVVRETVSNRKSDAMNS